MGKNKESKKKFNAPSALVGLKESTFKKTKQKVGKGKLVQKTTTDTSFKTRSVVVPTQTIRDASSLDSNIATTHRKLNLKDLISQLSHHNKSVKKDALMGLKELLTSNPLVLFNNLNTVIEEIVKLFTDSDRHIHHSVVLLLQSILPLLDENQISPFLPLVAVYVACGMTHLEENVRLKSLAILDVWLDHYPNVMKLFARLLLPNYVQLLSLNSFSKSSVSTSFSLNQSAVSSSPFALLGQAPKESAKIKAPQTSRRTQFFISTISSLKKYLQVLGAERLSFLLEKEEKEQREKDDNRMEWSSQAENVWRMSDSPLLVIQAQQQTLQIAQDPKYHPLAEGELLQFASKIFPIILQHWLEATPSTSIQNSNDTDMLILILQTISILLDIIDVHTAKGSEDETTKKRNRKDDSNFYSVCLLDCQKYIVIHFPFEWRVSGTNEVQSKSNLIANITTCSMMSHLLNKQEESEWGKKIIDYICEVLEGEISLSRDHSILVTVLQLLKRMLPLSSTNTQVHLLQKFSKFFQKSHTLSVQKKECIRFISELVVNSRFATTLQEKPNAFSKLINEWVKHCASLVGDFSTHSEATAQQAIELLRHFMKFSDLFRCEKNPVQRAIISLFSNEVKNKKRSETDAEEVKVEEEQKQSSECIFVNSSSAIQKGITEIIYYLFPLNQKFMNLLSAVCYNHLVPSDTIQYLIEVVHQQRETLGHPPYLCFLFTILMGMANKTTEEHQARVDRVIDVVLSHFTQSSPPNPLILLSLTIFKMIEGGSKDEKEKKYSLKSYSKRVLIRFCSLFWPELTVEESKLVGRLSNILPKFIIEYLIAEVNSENEAFGDLFFECTLLLGTTDILDPFLLALATHLPQENKKKKSNEDGLEFLSPLRVLSELLENRELRALLSEAVRLARLEKLVAIIISRKFSSFAVQKIVQKIKSSFRLLVL